MADRMAAEIWIGGSIPESLVDEFCGHIRDEGVSVDDDESPFEPRTAQDLLEAATANGNLLRVFANEVANGEFSDLEAWLQEHDIPYTRKSDGKYEHDPVVVEFRPEEGLHEMIANKALQPVVPVEPLRKVVRRLQAATALPAKKKPKKARKRVQRALKLLTRHLPSELPPLLPLEIVHDGPEDKVPGTHEG